MMIDEPGVGRMNGCKLRRIDIDLLLVGAIGCAGAIEHEQFEMAERDEVGRREYVAAISPRGGIEIIKPASPRPLADFVIASREGPGRGSEELCRGREEIGGPRFPVIAGCCCAAGLGCRALAF